MAAPKKLTGVQQILLSQNDETKALLEYLCQQSGKLYNSGVYYARKIFFKTNKLLNNKSKYSEKPIGWKASGKRVQRGLYQSTDGSIVNADLNGAANILNKVAKNLGIDLSRLGRRCLTTVARVRLWVTPKSTLSVESSVSLDLRVSKCF